MKSELIKFRSGWRATKSYTWTLSSVTLSEQVAFSRRRRCSTL